ncbi:GMC family oxidoreductase [Chachezhania sediminis]|uniref:GMC family oxidoreductase n=1 Tax=Chachezhania sediminis TaxID=2599291 RepID=UPI00131B9FCA|nr:GMC family oxidoreductase N-terminal domain-containing protein [Chachezhania sediminis]
MTTTEVDYVIVGAGSAGCTLAARLSEDKDTTVMVLEAGGPDRNPWIRIPLGWPHILSNRMDDWMYFSEPQSEIGSRAMEFARGKVLGGSSSINAMAYVRGHRGDYDALADAGLAGWGYDDVLPYFRRQESWEGGASDYRGGDGPLTTRFSTYPDPLVDGFTRAGLAAGHPWTDDYNGAQQEGFGAWQFSIRKGRRCSNADAYLKPALRRANLTLKLKALATQILFDGPRAVGIAYLQDGTLHRVHAAREVLLCGGVVNSPQLLNLSGIGDPQDLAAVGIAPRVALPGVGRNLQDHLSAAVFYARKDPGPLHRRMRADRLALELGRAYFAGRGIATNLPVGSMAFLKSDPGLAMPDLQFKTIAAPIHASPHMGRIRPPYQDGFSIRAIVLRPESRGRIRLISDDPAQAPRIDQNFLTADADRALLRQGLRMARDVGRQAPLAPFVGAEVAPKGYSDDVLDALIHATAITVHHPLGTCRMGQESDPETVVDARLNVLGTEGLRVVDASVFPTAIGGNINAPVTMLAERAADLVRGLVHGPASRGPAAPPVRQDR